MLYFVQQKKKVDFQLLKSLNNDDLKEIGVDSFGHRKKILLAIDKIKSKDKEMDKKQQQQPQQHQQEQKQQQQQQLELRRQQLLSPTKPHTNNETNEHHIDVSSHSGKRVQRSLFAQTESDMEESSVADRTQPRESHTNSVDSPQKLSSMALQFQALCQQARQGNVDVTSLYADDHYAPPGEC